MLYAIIKADCELNNNFGDLFCGEVEITQNNIY